MPSKTYIFGYGSLVCPDDIAVTLGHPVDVIQPVTLQGWIRDWSVVVDNRLSRPRYYQLVDDNSIPDYVVALNVRRPTEDEVATNPNGVLFEVTEADLLLLDARESHYARVDVTEDITGRPVKSVVYAYTGLHEHIHHVHDKRFIIVPGSYSNLVVNGFERLGTTMYHQYIASTQPSRYCIQSTVCEG